MTGDLRLIARFLGDAAAVPGPGGVSLFALLGIRRADASDREIDEAVANCLSRIDQHPQARSIEAERLRMLVCVAGAQLKDPEARTAQVRGPGGGPAVDKELVAAARRALAVGRGWTPRARSALSKQMAGHAWTGRDVGAAVRAAARAGRAKDTPGDPTHRAVHREREDDDRRSRRLRLATAACLCASAVAATALVALVIVQSEMGLLGTRPPQRSVGAGRVAVEEVMEDRGMSRPAARQEGLVAEARALAELEDEERETRPREVVDQLVSQWLDTETGVLVATAGALATAEEDVRAAAEARLIELARGALGRAGSSTESAPEDSTSEEDRTLAHAIGAAGVLARVAKDTGEGHDLLKEFRRASLQSQGALAAALVDDVPDTLWEGIETSLLAAAELLIDGAFGDRSASRWQSWGEAFDRFREERTEAASRLLVRTLDRQMRDGANPTTDRAAHEAIATLAARIRSGQTVAAWLEDGSLGAPAIERMVEALPEELRTRIPDLAPGWAESAASRLAVRSAIGRDPEPADEQTSSSEPDEQEQREPQIAVDRTPWQAAAVAALEQAGSAERSTRGTGDELIAAARLAWINAAARAKLAADDELVSRSLARAAGESSAAGGNASDRVRASTLTGVPPSGDLRWALRVYRAGRDAESREREVQSISDVGPAGPADADLLGELAMYGSPSEVRRVAQDVVRNHMTSAYVVNGLLEASTEAARFDDVRRVVEDVTGASLGDVRTPGWRTAAQRALLETLLGLVRPASDRAASIDRAANEITAAAWAGAGEPGRADTGDASWQAVALAVDEMLGRAARLVAVGAGPEAAEEIGRRRAARRTIARGGIRRHVAEQTALVEAMALVAAAERPRETLLIRAITERAENDRESAIDASGQLLANERALTRLWAVRLGEALASMMDGLDAQQRTTPSTATQRFTSLSREVPPWIGERLAALTPDDAMAYFELAEEVAYWAAADERAAGGPLVDLARELAIKAAFIDRTEATGNLGPSVCVLLAELEPAEGSERRRWLLALADALGRQQRPRTSLIVGNDRIDPRAAVIAEQLIRLQAGKMRSVSRLLESINVSRQLVELGIEEVIAQRVERLMAETVEDLGRSDVARVRRRPAPGGEEWVPDPRSGGNPGPNLDDQEAALLFGVQLSLLGARPANWSIQFEGAGNRAVRELDETRLADVFGVPPDQLRWSGGRWTE